MPVICTEGEKGLVLSLLLFLCSKLDFVQGVLLPWATDPAIYLHFSDFEARCTTSVGGLQLSSAFVSISSDAGLWELK